MKRPLAIAIVALLVIFAGCSMTSPAADEARNPQQTTTQESSPNDTVPIQSMLPNGYDQQGDVNATVAYEAHVSAMEEDGYVSKYQLNRSDGDLTRVVNGSGPERTWEMTTVGEADRERTVVYQDGDTRLTHVVYENGTAETTRTETPYAAPEAVIGDDSLRTLLDDLTLAPARSMPNSSFVFFPIESFDNSSVSQGHFMVMPSGQIRVVFLETETQKIVYTSATTTENPVQVPAWASDVPTTSTGNSTNETET